MRSELMDANGLYLLEWHIENKDIIFTATVNTRGYIGLGFSYKHASMTKADLVIAWVDDRTNEPNVLVSAISIILPSL
jgi:fructose-1,6-bisphosphatase/sedoheptulose 1,7-bisphosphatase-like protein